MKLVRLIVGLCLLFGVMAPVHGHQIDAIEFEFQSDAKEWRLVGEMDIAFMLPEMRGVPGGLPLSRKETLKAPPDTLTRYREETEKTLRKVLRLTFAGKDLPWQIRFTDFETEPFDLPPEAGDIALLSVKITVPVPPGAGVQEAHWTDDQESELIVQDDENGRLMTAPPGRSTVLARIEATGEPPVPAKTPIGDWIVSGFHHVVPLGLDHLLFIIGLFLLAPRWKPLMGQSLLFTVAHSLTLALSILGFVSLPGRLVDILIAAIIALIGIENLFAKKLGPQRLILVFAFGLIHGMGFASVLAEKLENVPRALLTVPLLGFNIGVELAQITVLAVAFLVTWPLRRWMGNVRVAGSVVVALAGLWWMFERIFSA
jgi:hypothetical protein